MIKAMQMTLVVALFATKRGVALLFYSWDAFKQTAYNQAYGNNRVASNNNWRRVWSSQVHLYTRYTSIPIKLSWIL